MMRLFGVHNPTREVPTFLLPLFSGQAGDNAKYMQIVDDAFRVVGFSQVVEEFAIKPVFAAHTAEVGGAALYAFAFGEATELIGPQDLLAPVLSERISEFVVLERPLFLLQVIEFCQHEEKVGAAVRAAYNSLLKVSQYSADFWRDYALLTPRVRRLLKGRVQSEQAALTEQSPVRGAVLRIINDVPVLALEGNIARALAIPEDWIASVSDDLRPYLEAFTNRNIEVRQAADGISDGLELDGGLIEGSEPGLEPQGEAWVAVGFGGRSNELLRRLQQWARSFAERLIVIKDSGANPELLFAQEVESRHLSLDASSVVLLFVDANAASLDAAKEFARVVGSSFRCHGLMVYPRDDGLPFFREGDILSAELPGITIVPTSRMPLGEGVSELSDARVILSLLQTFAERSVSSPFYLQEGLSVYAHGTTKGGASAAPNALEHAIAGAVNPWLPLETAEDVRIVVTSVGKARHLPSALLDLFDDLTARPRQRKGDAKWLRRRFIYGAPQPASVDLLLTGLQTSRSPIEERLLRAAAIMLRLARFEVDGAASEGVLTATADRETRFFVSAAMSEEWLRSDMESPSVNVLPDRNTQLYQLRGGPKTSALPLILSDLYYLRGAKDPRWTLQYLMYRALPRATWSNHLYGYLSEQLVPALSRSWEARALREKLSGLAREAAVESIFLADAEIRALPGRRLRLSGRVDFAVRLSYERDTYDLEEMPGKLRAYIGPDGVDIRSADIDPSRAAPPRYR